MLAEYSSVLVFTFTGLVILEIAMVAWWFLRPSGNKTEAKLSTYECGEEAQGTAWIQFNIRFYVVALIFIIFDVEIIFLLPWAVVFKGLGPFAFVEGLIFIAVLVVGLAYVWRKGDLAWVKPEDLEQARKR